MDTRDLSENIASGSDEELYLRFLSYREEPVLETLIERHEYTLTLFLYGYLHNMEDAEDIMIDSFAEAAARQTWSLKGSTFKTWLFAVARKKALMCLRKRRIKQAPLEDDIADRGESPESELLKKERDRKLYRAMERLNPDYRQVLMLIYFEQMSHEEAARVMGKSKKQIYHLVQRGRERLRNILEDPEFELG